MCGGPISTATCRMQPHLTAAVTSLCKVKCFQQVNYDRFRISDHVFLTYSILNERSEILVSQSVEGMDCGLESRGFESRRKKTLFCILHRPDQLRGLPNLPFNGHPGTLLRVRRLESESDHSLLPTAEIKNAWSYTSTRHHCCLYGLDKDFLHATVLNNSTVETPLF